VPTPMTLDVTILLCAHARHPHSPNVLAEADQAPSAIAALFARSIGVHRRLRLESGTLQVPIPPSKRYAERNHREYPGGKARARIVALLTEQPTLGIPRSCHSA
jgi:hypothetical protein